MKISILIPEHITKKKIDKTKFCNTFRLVGANVIEGLAIKLSAKLI